MIPTTRDYLYAVIDTEVFPDPIDVAERAIATGCARLQLRAKRLDDRSFLELARQLRLRCDAASVPFVVNDRPDLAVLARATSVHLGQDDMSIADARRVVGELEIGVSTHTLSQAQEAEQQGADYIAFGPVYPTSTKRDPDPVVGLRLLGEVCLHVSREVVAIGGINSGNTQDVIAAGASQVAVISGLPGFLDRPPG